MKNPFTRKQPQSLLLLLLSGIILPVAAQTAPAKTWAYDAISVKPNPSGIDGLTTVMRGDVYSGENMRIINMVSQAYDIKQDLIFAMPGWAAGAHFDVEAKMSAEDTEAFNKLSPEAKKAASQVLLRGILEERFHLKAHLETRQLPIYDLVIAKNGFKIKAATGDPAARKVVMGPDDKPLPRFRDGMLNDQWTEMAGLAGQLTNVTHRLVVDKTGLKGRFDFVLLFTPDRDAPSDADNGTPQNEAPSLFAALEEQLGLKLQPNKGPVQTVVIDHVQQPTEN